MRKGLKSFHIASVLVMVTVFVLCFSSTGFAYTTPSFNVDITVNKDCSFDYKEDITVNFESARHGIFRNIPMDKTYRIQDIKVGNGYEYEVSNMSGNKVIKIGSGDILLTGDNLYPISYRLRGVEDADKEHDYMYIDVLPTGWDSAIDKAKVTIHLPADLKWDEIHYHTAAYGGESVEYGRWTVDEKAHTITYEGENLPQGVGATVRAVLPEGSWENPLNYEWAKKLALWMAGLVTGAMVLMRLTVGRNPTLVEPVEFYPPEGLPPLELGYFIDGNVDKGDITSTFFYLADKGYIGIEEYAKKKFKFTRLAVPTDEPKPVQRFYKGLFGSHAYDDISTTAEKYNSALSSSIGERLSTAYNDIPELVNGEFSGEKKLFTTKSRYADLLTKLLFFATIVAVSVLRKLHSGELQEEGWPGLLFPTISALILLLVLHKLTNVYYHRLSRRGYGTLWRLVLWLFIYLFLSAGFAFQENSGGGIFKDRLGVALTLFMLVTPVVLLGMRTRGRWSNDIYGRVLGFRHFIKTAEIDKLNTLLEENPSYFYNILPYAYVFGLTEKWVKKFEGIAVPEPGWYTPYGGGSGVYIFDARAVNHMCNSVTSSIASSLNTADSGGGFGSSGGGFSGGGFSGGGFGGGGGGSW